MMAMIDTHKAIKKLMAGKSFTKAQAEKLVDVVQEADSNVASKKDIELVRKDLKASEGKLSNEIELLRKDLRSEIGLVRKDMQLLEQRITNHLYGGLVGLAMFLTAVMGLFISYS